VGRLVDAYLGTPCADEARRSVLAGDKEAAETLLAALYDRGRSAHPNLKVADIAFAMHLGRCGAAVERADAQLMHVEDLYLSCAALLGDESAARTLRLNHRATIVNALRAIAAAPDIVDEVEQRLWERALSGSAEAPPKLFSYSGRGPLASWTGVVAQRLALSLLRHEAAGKRALEGVATEARLAAADPELAFVKASLRDAFQRALLDALLVLDDRQRMIYRLHIVDGLTVERIATMYGVVRSTVTRWLTSARETIIDEAKRLLRDEMRLPAEDFESLARLLASQLDLSVSQILGGEGSGT